MIIGRARSTQAAGTALLVAALTTLAACGSTSKKPEAGTATAAAQPQTTASTPPPYASEVPKGPNPAVAGKTVGLVSVTQASELFPREEAAFREAAAVLGWKVKLVDLQGDPSKTPAAVENLVQAGVDAIVLESVEPFFLGSSSARAKAAGVPIMATLVGTPASASKRALLTSVVEPLAQESTELADRMVDDSGGSGDVAVDGDKISPVGVIPETAMRKAIDGKMTVVATHQIDYTKLAADANAVTQSWLVKHPGLKAIWCPYDGACVGAAQAVQASGNDVGVYSFNGSKGTMDLIRQGARYVSMAAPVEYAAYLSLDALNAHFRKERVAQDLVLHDQLTDKANVPDSGVVDGTSLYGDFRADYAKRWGAEG
jgi:ribose transport system substrate-binding protein